MEWCCDNHGQSLAANASYGIALKISFWNTAPHSHSLLWTIYYLRNMCHLLLCTLYCSRQNDVVPNFPLKTTFSPLCYHTIINIVENYSAGYGIKCICVRSFTLLNSSCALLTTFTKKSLKAKRIFGGERSSNMLVQETITIAPFPKMACMPLALQLQFLQIQNSVQYFRVLHC